MTGSVQNAVPRASEAGKTVPRVVPTRDGLVPIRVRVPHLVAPFKKPPRLERRVERHCINIYLTKAREIWEEGVNSVPGGLSIPADSPHRVE